MKLLKRLLCMVGCHDYYLVNGASDFDLLKPDQVVKYIFSPTYFECRKCGRKYPKDMRTSTIGPFGCGRVK
jgi:hypothetical protein